jgi:hypothetical protein
MQELKLILLAVQFQSVQELVRGAQGVERVMNDTQGQQVSRSDYVIQKKGFHTFYREESSSEKRKGRVIIRATPEKRGSFVHGGSLGGARRDNVGGSVGGQARQGASVIGGSWSRGDLSTRYA